ncbi:MAG: isoprenylcysteine carboxylmethyltransferase family protein [Betaproteobacteria bacterium]|nr:isoprenylcysteine carboxylmethyltransferase family protein [Betaproteobacteria bacterium]
MNLKGFIYVVVQILILVLMTSRLMNLYPETGLFNDMALIEYLGLICLFGGVVFAIYSALFMGNLLTPFPQPKKKHQLIVNGPFGLVRHPIYFGLLLFSVGALCVSKDILIALYGLTLFVTLYFKARYEEELLLVLYADYIGYQKAVKRLIPFIF